MKPWYLIRRFALVVMTASCWLTPLSLAPAQQSTEVPAPLDGSMSLQFLQENLRQSQPRLGLTQEVESQLRTRLKTDPVLKHQYGLIRSAAYQLLDQPLLQRRKIGKRLLSVSRKMLERMNLLCLVYRLEKSPEILKRINDELLAVTDFEDWNPSHFLDVGEMTLAVSIGLDWTAGDLPEATIANVRQAIIEKGLKARGKVHIVAGTNNWNQVCNGGLIAGALAIADTDPELAALVIQRAIQALPLALTHYGPDGAHPEGSSYWEYATKYTACTSTILESALGTDFGIFAYPGVQKSAMYRLAMTAPSQQYYNYGDGALNRSSGGDLTLSWFAAKTGDTAFYEKQRFLRAQHHGGRFAGFAMIWLSQFQPKKTSQVPTVWFGRGINPVVVFQDANGQDAGGFYFGGKGGSAAISHGNMDAGSFIFELDGVRWAVDPGRRSYYEIEKTGFELWGRKQDSPRWTLLAKNNYGHSTLTVNDALHVVHGTASLSVVKQEPTPTAVFDMTAVFGDAVADAQRTFVRESNSTLLITDEVVETSQTKKIVWQMLTTADVTPTEYGALLQQSGKSLRLENVSFPDVPISIVDLNPPPLKIDIQIADLKRLEIHVPVTSNPGNKITIQTRLVGSNE